MTLHKDQKIKLVLDLKIPPIEAPKDSKYIKYIKMKSKLLSEFWGRPMELGAIVLLPKDFDQHPDSKYPLIINHGHFPSSFSEFRTTPPDKDLKANYSPRFGVTWLQQNDPRRRICFL